ncbi:phosphohydrolase [Microbacterium sp. HA-8]|uniref:phosphohydrolase n=1 Tax=Microbacterium sp. HA-8 TaxID=3234200 RepID=UPI0038F7204C
MTAVMQEGWSHGPFVSLDEPGRVEQVSRAQAVAVIAHRRRREYGERFIHHAARVASGFDPMTETLQHCAAWLHAVLETTDISEEVLSLAGVHPEVIDVVRVLTRRKGEADDYYERIRSDPVALAVAYAAIADNANPSRLDDLDAETRERISHEYVRALGLLNLPEPDHWMSDTAGGYQVGNVGRFGPLFTYG